MTVCSLLYKGFKPEEEKLREALCTLGNGYFATRGASPESEADETHYPGTYLAGGYNRLKTNMAGCINIIQKGFTGVETREGVLWFNPCLPEELGRLRMEIRYRGHSLVVEIEPQRLKITACKSRVGPVKVGFKDRIYEFKESDTLELDL